MGTSRQTTPRRGTTIGDSDADRWLRGEEVGGFFEFRPEAELEALWRERCDDIVAEYVDDYPGQRPQRWWEYSAPRSPRGTYKGCAYDGELPEPRKRLGGIGTPAYEVLNYMPSFQFGLPTIWISPTDVDYYNREGLFKHVAPNPNSAGPFTGVAIDSNDPPIFESEASYLDRHGLFLPGEKKRLKKSDFEPETMLMWSE
jgi:hypothetical protein